MNRTSTIPETLARASPKAEGRGAAVAEPISSLGRTMLTVTLGSAAETAGSEAAGAGETTLGSAGGSDNFTKAWEARAS